MAVKHGDKAKRPANSAQNQYVSHRIFFGTCHSHDLHLLLGGWIATFYIRLQNTVIIPNNTVTLGTSKLCHTGWFLGVFPITGLTFFNIVLATLPTTEECSPFWFLSWVKKTQNLKTSRCTLRAPDHKWQSFFKNMQPIKSLFASCHLLGNWAVSSKLLSGCKVLEAS